MKAISGDCFANAAIRFCFVDTISEFRCIRRVSQKRFHESASRFPPLAPAGCCSPASSVLSRRYDALQPSRRTSFPSLGGTSDALVAFAPGRTSAPPRPGVGNPVSPSGISPRSEQGSPKFLFMMPPLAQSVRGFKDTDRWQRVLATLILRASFWSRQLG